ncbi:MAG: cytidine deaminase [Lachnospiraceae bacterium]|nr:cytidine deaminase [Lachnospiraceae bacterium]
MNIENEDTKLPVKAPGTGITKNGESIPSTNRISDLKCRELIAKAMDMLKYSYTPYSHFKVGAALLTKSGRIYGGCNIENAAYGPSNCAERTAFFNAVSEGNLEFAAIAIVGGPEGRIKDFCPPCGVCRQVMREFCDPKSFYVILARSEADYWVYTLEELLPMSFGPENL